MTRRHAIPAFVVSTMSPTYGRYSVSWETPDARFHTWVAGAGPFDRESLHLYKNPPLGVAHDDPASFETRHLDFTAAAWSDVFDALNAIPAAAFEQAHVAALAVVAQVRADKKAEFEAHERATLAELFAKYGPPKTDAVATSGDVAQSLAVVWDTLGASGQMESDPEGWDNTCTAMAWITEETHPATAAAQPHELETLLEGAATLWESFLDNIAGGSLKLSGDRNPYESTAEVHGYAATRAAVVGMAHSLESAWQAAQANGFEARFEWEFCPLFLESCVALSGDGETLPTLRDGWDELALNISAST
jgi:hypothetical protein